MRLRVPSIERALEFYRDLLGLRSTPAPAEEYGSSSVWLAPFGGGRILTLEEDVDATSRPPGTTGLYHYALLVPSRLDLARVFLRLYDARWPFQGFSDHAVSEAIYLADADGNGIEIYRDRPRSEWRRQNGAIYMTTRPLDIDSFAAELQEDDQPEDTGLAAGTTVGHIHLHVADLARAERFYHELLGFDVTTRGYPGALFLAAGGYHHHVGMNTWAGEGAPRPPSDAVGLIDFEIIVDDAQARDAIAVRLQAGGVEVSRPANRSNDERAHEGDADTLARDGSEATPAGFRVHDPDGIQVVVRGN